MKRVIFILFFFHYFFISFIVKGSTGVDSLIQLLSDKKNTGQVYILISIGDCLTENSPEAFSYYRQAYDMSSLLKNDSCVALSAYKMGMVKAYNEEYLEAKKYLTEAGEWYRRIGFDEKSAAINKQLGLTDYYLGYYREAIDLYQNALRFYLEKDSAQEVADIYQNIGLVHHDLENINEALDNYERALRINEKLNSTGSIAALTQNIGLLYIRNEEYDKALDQIQKSLKTYRELKDSEGIGISFSNIGLIYQYQGKYRESLDYYTRSLQVFDSIGYIIGKIWALHNVGTSYADLMKYDEALDYYHQSLKISEESGHVQGTMANYEAISNLYSDRKDFEKSLIYYKLYDDLSDSINSEQTKKKISETEAFYRLELLSNDLSAKSDELAHQKKQIRMFFIGSVVLSGLLLLLIFAYIQKRRAEAGLKEHRTKLETLVEKKTKELKYQINERKTAEESDRLKSAFLANMSHEFRTPLNAIIAFSNFIRDPALGEEKKTEYIHYIMAAGESLIHLIDDVIDISKIEARQISIHPSSCNITLLCIELYKVFEELKKKKQKDHLQLRIFPESLKNNIIIKTDPQRLRQVLSNLLENAVKYTNQGYIEFGYKKMEKQIRFFVKDTGIGIPREKFGYIFERFSQLNYSTHKDFGGTGLGLAITKNIVKLLGGDIWLESIENKGSVFYFSIPFSEAQILPFSPDTIEKKSLPAGMFGQYDWSGKTILIAEDEDLNYKVLESALSRTNARIMRARNGFEAIEKTEKTAVDLILMDIQMPKMDGYEATRVIKKKSSKIPVIAQTSFAMEGEKEKCLMAGCDDYLSKPLNLNELFTSINSFFNTF